MVSKPLKMFKVNSLSDVRDVDSLYCIKTSTDTEFTIVVTDAFGNIVNLKDLQTPSGIQGIASDDGTIEVTGSTFKNLRLSATLVNAINSALKAGDNISELVNDAGYLTSFTETDPIFQASEASLFISGDKSNLDNQSGINTGDETVTSIQSKRPLKTVDSKSLEGAGNIEIDYNTVINKPTSFPPSTHTHTISDVDNLQNELDDKASILHATTHEVNGSDPINGENLSVNVLPPTANYIPFSPTLKGHLQGIDTALGDVVQTTAGITSRVFFTGDLITLGTGNFYLSNYGGKGTVAGVSPTPLINDDNQKKYFTQDIISVPFTLPVVAPAGVYSGNLSVRINNDNAQQRYTIEVYRTALDGTPLPSGVSGAPVGDLGVTVLSTLDSGLLNLVGGDISSINLSGYLTQEITFNVNERLRYRISAEKVGTTGGNITMEVFYGNNYNSYYDVPVIADTNSVLNRSTVIGTTTTNALDSLNSLKANISQLHNPVTIGTANGLSLSTQVLSLGLASSGVNGALSGTDWNTFNNKQNALTNPVTGTGATGQVSFWNGTNTQTGDNGLFWDNTNKRLGINTSVPSFMLSVDGANALASFRRNATPITSSPKFLFTRTGATLNTDITAGMQLGGIQFRALTGGIESDYSALGYFANSGTIGDGVFKFLKSNLTSSVMDINSTNGRVIFQDGGTFVDDGQNRVQITGTAISQGWKVTGGLVTQYQTGTGTLVDFNSGVRTAPLTGFTSGAGTVSASDNVLQAIQKLDGNIGSIASSGSYTPTLTSGSNITSLTFNSAFYTKVGNVVTARITVTFSTTVGNTASSFNFSLPLNKTGLTSVSLGNGTSITGASVSNSVDVVSTTSNNIATASFISGAGSGANGKVTVFIMYDITQ